MEARRQSSGMSLVGEGEQLLLVRSTAWDGATEGRMETILRCTDYLNHKRVRTFFARADPLEPLIGECFTRECTNVPANRVGPRMAVLSKYTDNIYMA